MAHPHNRQGLPGFDCWNEEEDEDETWGAGCLVFLPAAPKFPTMNHSARVYDNVFEMLPSEENPTPMVRINRLNKASDFRLYAKLEWMSPFGSVKDRAAWNMLRDLEQRGEIGGQRGIVEPTSGNTGISLAAMARAR